MTNNWTDIGNSSLVFVMGANPSENHPACMAHINNARSKGAKLVVVDPRKTRTATQADRFIRIRPGTNIAFMNAVIRGVIADMEARPSDGTDTVRTKFYEFLNRTDAGTFFTDGDAATPSQVTDGLLGRPTAVPFCSKYTDARFIVKSDDLDYDRETVVAATGLPVVGGEAANTIISNFPKKAVYDGDPNTTSTGVFGDPNTVYNKLKAHVEPYSNAVAADICGCTEADLEYVIAEFIANSRCSSPGGFGTGAQDPRAVGYRATTILYAMGITQHTSGAQNIKDFANLQTLLGNMGRAGGGINALRGIHNVQGSTDMGLLYGNIPAYSGNPTLMTSGHATPASNDANAFGKYMNALWGTPVSGTGNKASMDGSYDDAYNTAAMALQQRGFYNMTLNWFSNPTWAHSRAQVDAVYDLWPKTNGDDHITMFRKMGLGTITAAVVWGQNPAVTEPNQGKVRAGLENLDLLVCVDLFENETAACDRKAAGVTYLLPASSHVEEAGSVTNSSRVLQWRERTRKPAGNSKADLELFFRFAKALDTAGAFSHITAAWTAAGLAGGNAYTVLYGKYGWTPGDATAFEDVSFTDTYTQSWTG
ncbi:MAG: molybdopterin-dependent oxidoreductase, partial [Actinomycetota bacterium]|nr:molybdopterin-dependent oxidoreductase [Actinomycetota bacterium]